MNLEMAERAAFYLSLVLTLVLLWRLWTQKLHTTYLLLALYLSWDAIGALVLLPIPRDRMRYFYVYTAVRFVQWILDVLVVLDLVSLIAKRYAGIKTVARIAVTASVTIATLGAFLSSLIDLSRAPTQFPVLKVAQLVDRTISFSVLAFLTLMLVFLLWFPVRLNRNTVAYVGGFMATFASRFAFALLGNLLGPASFQVLSATELVIFCLILVYWIVYLNVANETADAVAGPWSRHDERRLIGHLESINETLLRSGNKPR